MKIIYTADLHGIEGLYSELFRLAVNWQTEAVGAKGVGSKRAKGVASQHLTSRNVWQ